jgi:hypothetical protein
VALRTTGLNYGVGVAMTVARAEWGKVPIPGEKGAITEPILGTLTYAVNNITLLPNPILPDPVISFVPSVGVLLHLCAPSRSPVPMSPQRRCNKRRLTRVCVVGCEQLWRFVRHVGGV